MFIVNWLRLEHQRETLIDGNINPLWKALLDALDETLLAFNELYRVDKTKLEVNGLGPRVRFYFKLPQHGPANSAPPVKYAEALIAYDGSARAVVATFKESRAKPVSLLVDALISADGTAELFLCDDQGQRIADVDKASRLLLESFLQELKDA